MEITASQAISSRPARAAGEPIPFDRIPVVDVGALVAGGADARRRLAEELGRACRRVGSFYVVNHGVAEELIAAAFAQAKRFFALPLAEKMKIHVSASPPHRGFIQVYERRKGAAAVIAASAAGGDFKEGIDFGPDLPADDPAVRPGNPFYGPNVWPADLPGFREAIEGYVGASRALGRRLLAAIALDLGAGETFFADKFDRPLCRLKVLHYPPPPSTAGTVTVGAGAHTDYSCVTILAQDTVAGLELRNCAGRWIPAPPMAGTLFVNLGDQMARWTNDELVATPHRAINRSGGDRYSIAFFMHPNFDAPLNCFESCQAPARPAKYPPITAGEDLLNRLKGPAAYDQVEAGDG